MKKNFPFLSIVLLLILLMSSIPATALATIKTEIPTPNLDHGFLVRDTDRDTSLPARFRNITALNISGSAQFKPTQLENIKSKINILDTYIVDLRQESHGFINDEAVSFYSPDRILNNGFNSVETLNSEIENFSLFKVSDVANIFNRSGAFREALTVEKSEIELNLVKSTGLNYILFSTRDSYIPTPSMTDSFVNFVVKTPSTTHLHFHCDYGEGRTTMFMAMFQMMKESKNKTLAEILKEQLAAGGIVLTDETTRSNFLQDFYDYTKDNASSNFKTPFSIWAQKNSKSTL